MDKATTSVLSTLTALVAAAGILLSTSLLAQQVLQSAFYRQSKLISSIVSQDSIGVADILRNQENLNMLVKFAGAVTSAYINFELIPINEANTFVTVFESVSNNVRVDAFEYHRKNLTIYGTAQTEADYRLFSQNLKDKDYFESVVEHFYTATDNTIRFELECTAAQSGSYLDFV